MKTVNSLSGGKTSSYIAVHYPADHEVFSLVCIDDEKCAPKDPSIIQYVNAKLEAGGYIERYGEFIATAEDDKTLYAMRDLEQYIGREIIWVRGRSFDNVVDNGGLRGNTTLLPNKHFRYCTESMKLEPIFWWWWYNIGVPVNMRIGFRQDEFDRIVAFCLNGPEHWHMPTSCSTKGTQRQKWEEVLWRKPSFPAAKDGITKPDVNEYWRKQGWIGGTLWEERRQIVFPEESNCVGCFHKKPATLSVMANLHPQKMGWFSRQEDKGKGTWLDSKIRYEELIANAQNWIQEMIEPGTSACDSGGCTD